MNSPNASAGGRSLHIQLHEDEDGEDDTEAQKEAVVAGLSTGPGHERAGTVAEVPHELGDEPDIGD